MCSVNGSTLRPSAQTMNGTRCAIRLEMNTTSRLSRSSLATATSHLAFFAAFSAAFSCGRRSSASEPLPVSISVNSATISKPSALANWQRQRAGLPARGRNGPASGSRRDNRRSAVTFGLLLHTYDRQYVTVSADCKPRERPAVVLRCDDVLPDLARRDRRAHQAPDHFGRPRSACFADSMRFETSLPPGKEPGTGQPSGVATPDSPPGRCFSVPSLHAMCCTRTAAALSDTLLIVVA